MVMNAIVFFQKNYQLTKTKKAVRINEVDIYCRGIH
jgi:hypothetical protein